MSAAAKIDKPIVGYRVKGKAEDEAQNAAPVEQAAPEVMQMNETLERPEILMGTTYKLKPPVAEHAMYITINDMILNEGTANEQRRPYEVFINSKAMEHYQWITALTRLLSACFRKGGDIKFLTEELRSVYDPNGGYFKKGGVFMPSLVADLGAVIEKHLKAIGMIEDEEMSEHTRKILNEKRIAFEAQQKTETAASNYPAHATTCTKCHTKAVIKMDGCDTCLQCGAARCG
ncbi:TSCPD domain-containing protein [Marinobacter salsuginis]|uniref:ribonucleoside-diphosphate reductase n=1 Tax=Marinobacter salsuginis TaxID=418719 RepID=A0A5M3Q1S4_9GAMM|nr:NrdJb [Marinobacter salsuginis]GBO89168.1 TSCPD domain-containing protein [Marinobacter salsuginis]